MNSCAPTAFAAADDLVERRVGLAERDVVGDRPREQVRLLRDHDDRAAQVLRVQRPQVDAVELDHAVARVVEPRDELRERRLARARRPDERDRLPGRDVEVEARQDDAVGRVGELDALEPHVPVRLPQVDRVHRVGHARLLLEHARDLLERGCRGLVRRCRTSPCPPSGRRTAACRAAPRAARRPPVPPSTTRKPPTSEHGRDGRVADEEQARVEDAEQLDHACAFTSR